MLMDGGETSIESLDKFGFVLSIYSWGAVHGLRAIIGAAVHFLGLRDAPNARTASLRRDKARPS